MATTWKPSGGNAGYAVFTVPVQVMWSVSVLSKNGMMLPVKITVASTDASPDGEVGRPVQNG